MGLFWGWRPYSSQFTTFTPAAEDLEDRDDGKTIKELVRDIEDLEPISGYGLFTVDRTTLTSTVSVMITYLIVLIQFKQTQTSSS